VYEPTGKVLALLYQGPTIEFETSWGASMIMHEDDFLVCPDPRYNEVYRIARKEFFETYEFSI